jgi:hypothetical protein
MGYVIMFIVAIMVLCQGVSVIRMSQSFGNKHESHSR